MLKLFLLILLPFLQLNFLFAQNLLCNGGFEDENICTEFKERCSPAGWVTSSLSLPVQANSYAMGEPAEGKKFIKIIAGSKTVNNARTFTSTRLLCGLRKGKIYKIEFNYRSSSFKPDSLGVYLSTDNFLYEQRKLPEIIPSIWVRAAGNEFGTDNSKWQKASLLYTATGNEVYFTIGAFKRNDFSFDDSSEGETYQYVYLDNMSMTPMDQNECLCENADYKFLPC